MKNAILTIKNLEKNFNEKVILDKVSFSLYFGQKVALIGQNGAGKSTLAKILVGLEEYDSGTIELFGKSKISYLPQEFESNKTVGQYLEYEKPSTQDKQKVIEYFDQFHFSNTILNQKVNQLSGGQKSKILIIKLILTNADIIILDEPTNNLDYEGILFLENFIQNSKSTFLIISHDRKFLDKIVSAVLYLDNKSYQIKKYNGNYSNFVIQRKEEKDRDYALYVENQKQKKKYEDEVERKAIKASRKKKLNKFSNDNEKYVAGRIMDSFQKTAGKNLKRAKSKLENFEEKEKPVDGKSLNFNFLDIKRSGYKVLEVRDFIKKYGNFQLGPISFEVNLNDRFLIAGKNGAGKTTLLKALENAYKNKESKNIFFGSNVILGILPQKLDYGKDDKNFFEYFLRKTNLGETEARKILSKLNLKTEEIFKEIKKLSPGQRARGRIALMMANSPNLIILDEPTNNIDMQTLEALESALQTYKGTIIFVSHDRYFIEKINPNKKIELESKG